ncbi:uncharacterized protein LOC129137475 isoform X2 [Pan troglodytes]|uniref:uncharacterized protein LOC129137475 isoform X2 n=1 Tax=Pan troglodytes TaxID=9598 RepID=UPI0023F4E1F0|nr:uncharacterized protein LOC129137475 isoform X2 [Pan troglodytes]
MQNYPSFQLLESTWIPGLMAPSSIFKPAMEMEMKAKWKDVRSLSLEILWSLHRHSLKKSDGAEPDTLTGSLGVLQRSNKRHLCPVASILGSCSMFDYISPYSFENSSSETGSHHVAQADIDLLALSNPPTLASQSTRIADWNDLEQPAE